MRITGLLYQTYYTRALKNDWMTDGWETRLDAIRTPRAHGR